MPKLTRRGVIVGLSALPASLAVAQPAPFRIRGRIQAVDGALLTIAAREGGAVAVRLGDATVVSLRRVSLAELAPGTRLGVVAEPAGEGLRAVAVTVLPPTATRDFQSPWDLSEGSSMNNGAVSAVLQRAQGAELVLSINGRDVPVRIDEGSALVRPVPAAREDLRPGAAVFVNAAREADGTLVAQRVTVEKDGVAPPT